MEDRHEAGRPVARAVLSRRHTLGVCAVAQEVGARGRPAVDTYVREVLRALMRAEATDV